MRKKWKCWSALGLAVMLGCMVPMTTMKAAEETESIPENSADDEMQTEQVNAEDEQETEPVDAEDEQETESVDAEDEREPESVDAEDEQETEQDDTDAMQETEQVDADVEQGDLNADASSEQTDAADGLLPSSIPEDVAAEEDSAPRITISFGGESDDTKALGDAIFYDYINHSGGAFTISAKEQGSEPKSLAYYLDTEPSETSMTREQMDDLSWTDAGSATDARIELSGEGKYVLYVKAVAENEQVSYARSSGIAVDMTPPVIIGIENGGTYPAGTKFGVTDANLESVLINENPVIPGEDGLYSVAPNGLSTSCIIRAKDKANNEIVYNITVTDEGENPGEENKPGEEDKPDEDDKPGDDITVITVSGTYSLCAGTAYRLDEGKWTVAGDSTVYWGGSTFYVNEDGDYQFRKR